MKTYTGLAVALILILGSLSYAQTTRVELGKTSDQKFEFTYSGNATDGTARKADAVEFIFRQPGVEPLRILVVAVVVTGLNNFHVSTVIGTIPDGDYEITARLRGDNGNWSTETPAIQRTVSSKKPDAPGNFTTSG